MPKKNNVKCMVICSLRIIYVFQSSFELKPIGRKIKNTVIGTNKGNREILDMWH